MYAKSSACYHVKQYDDACFFIDFGYVLFVACEKERDCEWNTGVGGVFYD